MQRFEEAEEIWMSGVYGGFEPNYWFLAFLALHSRSNSTLQLETWDFASLVAVGDQSMCLRNNVAHFQPLLELYGRRTGDQILLQPHRPL